MKTLASWLVLTWLLTLTAVCPADDYIFDDEFSGSTLDPRWMAMNIFSDQNNERQCYTPSQVSVSGGYLNITAVAERTRCAGGNQSFASGAVVWRKPLSFKYGTVEYQAKFAGGKGTWPAVWLLGADCQPNSPYEYNAPDCHWPQAGSNEIDLTEIVHGRFTRPGQGAINANYTWTTCHPTVTDVTKNFHTYTFTWTKDKLTWYIDGAKTCERAGGGYVPSTPMYLIINTAVGGQGGTVVRSTLPQTTQIKYVRVKAGG